MAYKKTTWVANETPLSATNLNKIEDGIEAIDKKVDGVSENIVGTFNPAITSLNERIEDVSKNVTLIDEKITTLSDDLTSMTPIYSKNLYPLEKILNTIDPDRTFDGTSIYISYLNQRNWALLNSDIESLTLENLLYNLEAANPIIKKTTYKTFGVSLTSGMFSLKDAGTYTIKMFNHVKKKNTSGVEYNLGFPGVILALSPSEKRMKWASSNYMANTSVDDLCIADNKYVTATTYKIIDNPLVIGHQAASYKMKETVTFTKTTDDELYFCFFCAGKEKATATGYGDKTIQEELTPEEIEYIYRGIMVYKGDDTTQEFEAYQEDPVAYNGGLIVEVENLKSSVEKLKTTSEELQYTLTNLSLSESITLKNSDKIGFFGNSFLQGYTLKGHHPVIHLNGLLDYQFYNYSKSGDDLLETLERVENNSIFFDSPYGPKDWALNYAVIAQQDNDGALYRFNTESYYENAKKLANYLKGFGVYPIFGTEHDSSSYYYNMMRLCKEEGYMFMDWGKLAYSVFSTAFTPLAFSGHPATRTHWVWTYGMLQYLKTLPKVRKGIKIYKGRDDSYTLTDLKYDSGVSRFKVFSGISGGYTALSEASSPYYDRYDRGNTSVTARTVTVKNEYLDLINGTSITLTKYGLIEFITPYTSKSTSTLTLNIRATYTKAYIRRVTTLAVPMTSKRYLAFGIGENVESSFPSGSTIVISAGQITGNVAGTYTVDKVVNGMLITTLLSSGMTTSGTDILVCTVDGVEVPYNLLGSYDWASAQYAEEFNKPLMEWDEITITDNQIRLTPEQLQYYMDYDRVSILLECDSGVVISAVSAEVSGKEEKDMQNRNKITSPIQGTALMTAEKDFATNTSLWTKIGETSFPEKFTCTVTAGVQTERYPQGTTSIIRLMKDACIQRQLSAIDTLQFDKPIIQVMIIARWLPQTIFTDEDYLKNEITELTCPIQNLKVGLCSTSNINTTNNIHYFACLDVALWWYTFIINVPYYGNETVLCLTSLSDNIDIARIEVKKIDNYESINI